VAGKTTGLKATKLDAIRGILLADDEESLKSLAEGLIEKGAFNGAGASQLGVDFEAELLEVFALINSDPEILKDQVLLRMAKRTLGLLRAFRNAANITLTRD